MEDNMRNIRFVLMLLLAVFIFGCGATLSKDMLNSNMGLDSISNGNFKDAEYYLDEALKENPNNPFAILNMGVVYQNTNRIPQAKEMYEKVIRLNPQDIVSKSNLDQKKGKTLTDVAKENLNSLK
jgi:tetratricopeptide (TPR) repeat protein